MAGSPSEHEEGFLKFVSPPQQRRLRVLLKLGAKRRSEVRLLLDHAIELDPRYIIGLPGGEQFSGKIERRLKSHGAPDVCWVIAADSKIDGRQMPLKIALENIVGLGSGAFVSCIPGELGYFEFEHANGGQIVFMRSSGKAT